MLPLLLLLLAALSGTLGDACFTFSVELLPGVGVRRGLSLG